MTSQRPLIFGEVLYDCFPDGSEVLGGAPFNVSWNLQAFGMHPLLISRVGDDPQGLKIKETMASWSMNTDFLQTDHASPTGRVEITLTNGEPCFTILPDQAYDHISAAIPTVNEKPAFLYHGSLALRGDENRTTLARLKRVYPCPVFLDVNLRKPWWKRDAVLAMLENVTWLKLNDDECRMLFPEIIKPEDCGGMLFDRYPLETVFITHGDKGATALIRDTSPLTVQPSDSTRVVDTVGAGDAFSSVLLLGFMNDWPLQLTLERAQEFASAIVAQRGATIPDRIFYQKLYNRWVQ